MTKNSKNIEDRLDEIFFDTNLYQSYFPINSLSVYAREYFEQNNNKISEHMSDTNIAEVLVFILENVLEDKKSKSNSNNIKIEKLEDFFTKNEIKNIKGKIKTYLQSFPRKYVVDFSLDNVTSRSESLLEINDEITLSFEKKQKSAISSLEDIFKKDHSASNVYSLRVKINHSGYVANNNYEGPRTILKQIVCLALSLGIFKCNFDLPTRIGTSLLAHEDDYQFSRYMDCECQDWKKLHLPYNESDFLRKLQLDVAEGEDVSERIDSFIIILKLLYRKDSKNADAIKRIKSAFEWMYEARLTSNETFKYIFTFIAMEAVFGEEFNEENKTKPPISITSILKNRCAYLLAETHKEREDILKEFPGLYKLRSQLVHGSKSCLASYEREKLKNIESLLEKIIIEEMSMLHKGNWTFHRR
jgi:hypothetical protein